MPSVPSQSLLLLLAQPPRNTPPARSQILKPSSEAVGGIEVAGGIEAVAGIEAVGGATRGDPGLRQSPVVERLFFGLEVITNTAGCLALLAGAWLAVSLLEALMMF